MRDVAHAVDIASEDGDVTVLVLGETGVGKSSLAREIHRRSGRSSGPFIELNCAGFEPHLLESELFGHERGAFTGAVDTKPGLVEAAAGGTLFLDEVAELSLAAQAKLLSFLDRKTFRRLGGAEQRRADVRVIAATNADLDDDVEQGRFRADLYYRLCVLPIRMPPLRERLDELPRLVAEFVADQGHAHAVVPTDVMSALAAYDWPGNLRELRHAVERALLLGRGSLERCFLPGEVRVAQRRLEASGDAGFDAGHDDSLAAAERRHVLAVLAREGENRAAAARVLGISRSTLRRKLSSWGL